MKDEVRKFTEKSLFALGQCYVYGLIDPRNNKIFYIGKGTENRVFNHEYESLMNPESSKLKLSTIREIKEAGLEVKKIIINCNLTEDEAFAAEAALINAFNYVEDIGLTNDVAGHHSKEAYTVDEFERLFGAEEISEEEIKHHLFVIKVNKLYKRGMTKNEIYDVVRGCWKGNYPYKMDRLKNVQYVLGVYNDLVIGVYKPSMWSYVKDDPTGVPERDKENLILSDRVYFRDYAFENDEEMDEIQKYYLYKSLAQIKKIDKSQNPTYVDPK